MTDNKCPFCGGDKRKGSTTFTVDFKSGLLVVRNVPATICSQCGEEWIVDDVAAKLENVAATARKEKKQVEVVDFAVTVAA